MMCFENITTFSALCFLRRKFEPDALLGLLACLHRHKRDISFLQSLYGSQTYADAAVAALIGTQQLTQVDCFAHRVNNSNLAPL